LQSNDIQELFASRESGPLQGLPAIERGDKKGKTKMAARMVIFAAL
jgi:hypothetical protein